MDMEKIRLKWLLERKSNEVDVVGVYAMHGASCKYIREFLAQMLS